MAAAGDGQTYFPCPCRVGTALRRFLDVNAAPKKHFLVALAEHTAEPAPRARLLHLAARENQDAFHAHVLAGRRTHLDILEEFSSAQPPLGAVLQLLPRLHIHSAHEHEQGPRRVASRGQNHLARGHVGCSGQMGMVIVAGIVETCQLVAMVGGT